MKDFRGMKRQRSRNRKPSGNQNNPNRAYESNGPEGTKVRGNAQTIYEKYQQLARDANSSGDRVLAENHLQHAEHYFRLIRMMQPQRPVSEFVQRDPFSNGYDDFDDEIDNPVEVTDIDGEALVSAEGEQPTFDDNRDGGRDNNRDRQRFDRNDRNDRNGNRDRDRNDRNGNRDRNDRNDRNNRDRDRNNDRGDRQPYENREPRTFEPREPREPRNNEPRPNANAGAGEDGGFDADGNRRESRRERYERRRHQRLSDQEQNLNAPVPAPINGSGYIASTEPLGGNRTPAPLVAESAAPEQPVVRDADHLPAFIRQPAPISAAPVEIAAEVALATDEPVKPKRGRPKRKAEAATEEA